MEFHGAEDENMFCLFLYEIFFPPKVSSFRFKGHIGTRGELGDIAR